MARNRDYFVWGVVAFVVGVGGMLGILTFAGIALLPAWLPQWTIKVPVLNKVAHGSVVSAAVSWFAGTVALFTYFLTRDQKEKHLQAQLQETRKIEDERERRERDLAELQRLEAEFAALADDFAQKEALARINAAIGLGEIAFKPDPRRLDKRGDLLSDPRTPVKWVTGFEGTDVQNHEATWPESQRSLKTERNYPYFLRAVHRLAAALHQWEDEAPRAQALRVLREMGEWAKDEGTDEPLLHALVNALAEANRTAWALLREQAAMCLAGEVEDTKLLPLLGVGTMPKQVGEVKNWAKATAAFRADLLEGLEDSPAFLAFKATRDAVPGEKMQATGELDNQLRAAGQGLWATRDALATALRTLSPPPDLPEFPAFPVRTDGQRVDEWNVAMADWVKNWAEWKVATAGVTARREINLHEVRMFEADCRGAHFEGANCAVAHFEGANCAVAHFEGANCIEARFEGADCDWAHFEGANCREAHFERANCSKAHFEGANCREAHFERANCSKAHFKGANCIGARFEGSNCTEAYFQGARIAGADMGQRDCKAAMFLGREWEQADFHFYPIDLDTWKEVRGEMDMDLWNFLNKLYPEPEATSPVVDETSPEPDSDPEDNDL